MTIGAYAARTFIEPPPCRTAKGCPEETPEKPNMLTQQNVKACLHCQACRAVGRFADDRKEQDDQLTCACCCLCWAGNSYSRAQNSLCFEASHNGSLSQRPTKHATPPGRSRRDDDNGWT